MNNEEISVNGDEQDGEGGKENAGGLRRSHQLADDLLVIFGDF